MSKAFSTFSILSNSAQHSFKKTIAPFRPKTSLRELVKHKVGKDKTILITGASSGIGAEMTRVFARLGYNLAICARRVDKLETLKKVLMEQHPDICIEVSKLDVTDHDSVFKVFKRFHNQFGHLDRIIINAGAGEGRRIGKGHFDINKRTVEVNFLGGLAQCEAAMQIFRAQNAGHLVVISSISALRGLPKHLTTYAATKAALANLAEGIRSDMLLSKLPIKVTTIYPGYIRTEMNEKASTMPFEVDVQTGTNGIVAAIESGAENACVPSMPWSFIGKAVKVLPLDVINKLS